MAEDRLAKTERTLDRLAELLNHSYHQSSERMDRIEEQTARNAQLIQHNVQLIERNAQLIERIGQQIQRNGQHIQFLRELTQGHITQPKPPAHSD